jgi:hypothetical protein
MHHEEISADGRGAFNLGAEAGDRFGTNHGVERCQVHQVVDVNRQRVQVEAFARGLELFDLQSVGRARAPHPRAGGKDLKGVCAEFSGLECRFFERTAGERVNAEAQSYIVSKRFKLPATFGTVSLAKP